MLASVRVSRVASVVAAGGEGGCVSAGWAVFSSISAGAWLMDDVLGRDGDGVIGDEMRCVLLCRRHPYSGWGGYAMSDGWRGGG